MQPKLILSDTSCLIALHRIGQLEILHRSFNTVYTSKIVASEFGLSLPEWIVVKHILDEKKIVELEAMLDKGEASVIALALETQNSLLLIDEKKGRKIAAELGIAIAGTLQVLLIAKQKGVVTSVKSIVEELEANGFRFSISLKNEILKLASEL